jgi:Na+/H+-dicarboxylate symporter
MKYYKLLFSIFFGLLHQLRLCKPVVTALDKMSHIILKMVNYVMNFAQSEFWSYCVLPLGIFKN